MIISQTQVKAIHICSIYTWRNIYFTCWARMYFCEADNTVAIQEACASVPRKPSLDVLGGRTLNLDDKVK